MYNYLEAVKNDITENLNHIWEGKDINEENRSELEEELDEASWANDSITGNASGSYTFNRYEASEYVKENLKIAIEACEEFGVSAEEFGKRVMNEDWEYLDVTIRCYLLSQAISEVVDKIIKDKDYINTLSEEDKAVRLKLVEHYRDIHDEEWAEAFDTEPTGELISMLYDSYCDDCFWAGADIKLTEILAYYEDKCSYNEEEYGEQFTRIASYYLSYARDLLY